MVLFFFLGTYVSLQCHQVAKCSVCVFNADWSRWSAVLKFQMISIVCCRSQSAKLSAIIVGGSSPFSFLTFHFWIKVKQIWYHEQQHQWESQWWAAVPLLWQNIYCDTIKHHNEVTSVGFFTIVLDNEKQPDENATTRYYCINVSLISWCHWFCVHLSIAVAYCPPYCFTAFLWCFFISGKAMQTHQPGLLHIKPTQQQSMIS